MFNKIKEISERMEQKRMAYLTAKFERFIVDYKIEGDHIKVISNVGDYRIIKNTKSNRAKVYHAIIENKINISKKIDAYEKSEKERLVIFSINILLLCFMGAIVPASFFMGSYLLFMLAIIFFTFCVFTVSISGVNYYVIASEIRNLKFITGYKMSNEIELPSLNDITKINVKMKKSRN